MILAPRKVVRRAPIFLVIFVLLAVLIVLHRSRLLIALLFEDGAGDAVHVSALFNETAPSPPLIPKIIHQTYKNTTIPERWRKLQDQIRHLHPDYEYMFWTDDDALAFIQTHYPSFLATYISYAHPIQRADSIRYFLLHHYGGVYLDLDIAPYLSITPLLSLPAFGCLTQPTGISNDALGSVPGHPFFQHVISNLQTYNKNWFLPYITVMYSTGPLFLSVLWVEYISSWAYRHGRRERFMVLSQEGELGGYGILYNEVGKSWHGWDARAYDWMTRHWILAMLGGIIGVVLVVYAGWSALRRVAHSEKLQEEWFFLPDYGLKSVEYDSG